MINSLSACFSWGAGSLAIWADVFFSGLSSFWKTLSPEPRLTVTSLATLDSSEKGICPLGCSLPDTELSAGFWSFAYSASGKASTPVLIFSGDDFFESSGFAYVLFK